MIHLTSKLKCYLISVNLSQRWGSTLGYALFGFFGGVGANMFKASLTALNQEIFPITFSGLVAQPSTGKSHAMNFTVSAIESVERYLKLTDVESVLIQAPTVEGLFGHISRREVLTGKSHRFYIKLLFM